MWRDATIQTQVPFGVFQNKFQTNSSNEYILHLYARYTYIFCILTGILSIYGQVSTNVIKIVLRFSDLLQYGDY